MAKLTDLEKIKKYLTIEKHAIYAKVDIIINIDTDELRAQEEELIDIAEDETEELIGSISIPGMINIEVPDENDEVQLYFPFNINLIVSEVHEKVKNITTYFYAAGEMICQASTKSNATDIMILDKLFENRVKYLAGEMDKQVVAIYDQLLSTANIKMHHIEIILTQLYGEETEEGFTPVRLTKNAKYSKANAINTKDSAHKFNAALGFGYGYTKDAITDNITRTYETEKTDLEKIIGGNYNELGK